MTEDRFGNFVLEQSYVNRFYLTVLRWIFNHRISRYLFKTSIVAFICIAIWDFIVFLAKSRDNANSNWFNHIINDLITSFSFVTIPVVLFIFAMTMIIYIEAIVRLILIIVFATIHWIFK